ncbi:MAG: IclR family transcriptional regulator [Granulosicoccus sp.]
MSKDTPPPKVDSTLSKGLAILENLACSSNAKGVTELSRELGLTKSNAFRLLQTLKQLGYVRHGSDKRYSATLKTWQMGRFAVDNLNLRDFAMPEMNQLSRLTGEAIYLAVPDNLSVIYIHKIDGLKPIRSWNQIGGSAPMHCVGTGKAILAANYEKLRESVKHSLVKYTDNTIIAIEALDTDMEVTGRLGYAVDKGEYRERILSFGSAVELPDEGAIAALGISLPEVNLPDNGEKKLGELLLTAANSVSAKLMER